MSRPAITPCDGRDRRSGQSAPPPEIIDREQLMIDVYDITEPELRSLVRATAARD